MNPERLLQHFERISEAPDAIPRLRRFILDLAVRGKLVEPDPNDEPAVELLKRIQKHNAEFAKSVKVERSSAIRALNHDNVPFMVPGSWVWVSFGSIMISRDGERIPVSKEERAGRAKIYDYYGASGIIDKIHDYLFDKPLLLIGEDGANLINRSTPIAFIARGKYWVNNHAHVLDGISEGFLRFIELHINAIDLKPYVTGTAQPKMNQAKMNSIPIALPPLAEQHRIVAKVDELMTLGDQLEAAKTEREQSRDRLVAASLHRLNSPDDTAETDAPDLPVRQADAFRDHARFVFKHLTRLTTRPEHIKQLRQTILNLAVSGKLVSQDPNDESVDELLNRVSAERQRFIARGRLKAQKSYTDVDAAPPSQPIPAIWRWMRLADLISFGPQNGVSPKPTNNTESPKALTLTATTSGFFDANHYKYVELREMDCQNYWLSAGDVLFQRGNTREYVGIAAVFDGPEKSFVFPDLMIRVRFAEALSLRFIHMTLISPLLRRYFAVEATGASASMPKISQGVLLNAPIPLPPLAEQHRIVARVDELMALCDQLEAQLTATEADSHRLLEAVLHEVLAPELEETV